MKYQTCLAVACVACLSLALPAAAPAQERSADERSGGTAETEKPHTLPDDAPEPIHETITIVAEPVGPQVQPNLAELLSRQLISRDDQVLQLLGAGINGGQHEGGGKSLEIRRYGFNLDHGGAGGGLRITVDNVAQNYGTQGHGQGYVGALKSLTPELIEDVTLVNGPFRAEHGDFSGLGVVQIRLRESMPDEWTTKLQGGNQGAYRGFLAWSPWLEDREVMVAYDGSHLDGPFLRPLDYVRHNVTANYMWKLGGETHLGVKANGGLNSFNSSGQVPTDLVFAGQLSRFGSVSPGDGGEVQQGRLGFYYQKEFADGANLRGNAFVERSLFDLYSNFTFALEDPEFSDAIQQHDSRLSEGGDLKYQAFATIPGGSLTLSAGGNVLHSSNVVDLRRSPNRNPVRMLTSADADVTNGGVYGQGRLGLVGGRLQVSGGLRVDWFRFATTDLLEPEFSQTDVAGKLQPKAAISFTPWRRPGVQLFYNYGRGIASMDARGVVRRPNGPHVSTTDFQQFGFEYSPVDRWSLLADMFVIRQSNQLVYIPDDGSIEFSDPSRSYGYELKTSLDLTSKLGVAGSITKVLNAYFLDSEPRLYLERAPRFVAESSLVLSNWRRWNASVRMRAINHYRLLGDDPSVLAAGHTVFDVSVGRRLTSKMEVYFAADNVFDRDYWETQNYFESRLPGRDPMTRIHATPGFGRTVTVGATFRFAGSKAGR